MARPISDKKLDFTKANVEAAFKADRASLPDLTATPNNAIKHPYLNAWFKERCEWNCFDELSEVGPLRLEQAEDRAKALNGRSIIEALSPEILFFGALEILLLLSLRFIRPVLSQAKAIFFRSFFKLKTMLGEGPRPALDKCLASILSLMRGGLQSLARAARAAQALPRMLAKFPRALWRAARAVGAATRAHIETSALSDPQALAEYEREAIASASKKAIRHKTSQRL